MRSGSSALSLGLADERARRSGSRWTQSDHLAGRDPASRCSALRRASCAALIVIGLTLDKEPCLAHGSLIFHSGLAGRFSSTFSIAACMTAVRGSSWCY